MRILVTIAVELPAAGGQHDPHALRALATALERPVNSFEVVAVTWPRLDSSR